VTRLIVECGVALVASVALTPVAITLAARTGVVDHPGPLKPQSAPVPYLGGVAVFAAAAIGVILGRPVVIAPLAGALVLGLVDDRFDISARVRLLGQVVVGIGVALALTTRITGVGGAVAVTAVTVLLMNAVNFLDGLDGLASGVLVVTAGMFALLLHDGGRDVAAAVAAALVGFLVYNRPPARIYLGDGGAYFLGAALAALVASAWAPGVRSEVTVASLLLVAIPVAEVLFAVIRRARAHSPITSGDRRHPYDLLVARGRSRGVTALAYAGAQLVLAAGAWGISRAHTLLVPLVATAAVAAVLVAVAALSGALSPGPGVRT
jgi:UDP-GlcNAc:undecaprenyl-phosphate/decaprenyl-phosphate GlcNAc-1-phosphate transferase